MQVFTIEGGVPLHGDVTPSGNKNAALPLLAACLLTDEPVILHNIPRIRDVFSMRRLLESLGVEFVEKSAHTWQIHARSITTTNLNPEECKHIRASILLAGPLCARTHGIELPPPGGDVIGRRRVDTHILALEKLGVQVEYDRIFKFSAKQLQGADILLDEASVTATENAIMAAVLANGTTILRNAASEPHVQELCQMLNQFGAKIDNIGSNTLHIEGVDKLHGGEFTIGSDYLEVVSFISAAVLTNGSIRIKNAGNQHLDMIRMTFRRLGVIWEVDDDDIIVPQEQPLVIEPDLGDAVPSIKVMPWPSFPTDLMSIAIVVATKAKGSILFHDWMLSGRMFFTDKLVSMGAQIVLCDPHRCIVQGPSQLYGEQLESPDIRAGMALLLAALSARGRSVIRNIGQIDRGYEAIDEKLKRLGAVITRSQQTQS
ncbi:MAG: UDP-N-acetylglucosamine 1-carboxyvinyltransferase [Anaerolineae bacterium]|nr:UDP-N-acetylglucosamine 1-carboxyvinyltransferase [Anaerolineae bacterium]